MAWQSKRLRNIPWGTLRGLQIQMAVRSSFGSHPRVGSTKTNLLFVPVERCLACEAVVNRGDRRAIPFWHRALYRASDPTNSIGTIQRLEKGTAVVAPSPWSPRPRKRGSAPRFRPITSTRALAIPPASQTPELRHGWREDRPEELHLPPTLRASESRKDTSGRLLSALENRPVALPGHYLGHRKIREIHWSSGRRPCEARNRQNRCGNNHLDRNR